MVNKTELMALKWLKDQGYKDNQIMRKRNTSPDFICEDGKRYEVKFLYGDRIIFYSTQLKNLRDSDVVLVFDKTKLITKFLWKDRKKIAINIKIVEQNERTTIQIERKTVEKLKKIRIAKRESYDEIINKLIKDYSGWIG